MIFLTTEMIKSQRSKRGGWTKRQLEALGVDWPLKKGWMFDTAGVWIPVEQWEEFCRRPSDDVRTYDD